MPALRPLRAIALTLILAAPLSAQDRISKPPSPRTPPRTPAPAPAPAPNTTPPPPGAGSELPPAAKAELAPKPYRINSVGLTMRLPMDSQVQTTGAGELTSIQIMGSDKTWLINVRTPVTKSTRPAHEVAAEVRDQLLAMSAPIEQERNQPMRNGATTARMLHDIRPLKIQTESPVQARPASWFYLTMPRGEKEAPIIRGYAVFEVAVGRYATFDLTAPQPTMDKARAAFESCLHSIRFEDAASADAARGTAVERGAEFLTALTPEDYSRAIDSMKDQWYRLSRTEADGTEKEVAYRRVRAWKGRRGEMDATRDPKKWAVADRQEGYLVRIDARVLRDTLIVDSVGTFFMTPDRKEEAWIVQMVVRDPASKSKPNLWREMGGRSGGSMNVVTEGSGESKSGQPTVPDVGYITQVEAMLLPQLLLLTSTPEGPAAEYGFYGFQSEDGKVMLRRDRIAPATDGIGAWTITTRLTEDREPQVAAFSESGLLARNRLPDGSVWTPITLTKLAEIWKAKRLPME